MSVACLRRRIGVERCQVACGVASTQGGGPHRSIAGYRMIVIPIYKFQTRALVRYVSMRRRKEAQHSKLRRVPLPLPSPLISILPTSYSVLGMKVISDRPSQLCFRPMYLFYYRYMLPYFIYHVQRRCCANGIYLKRFDVYVTIIAIATIRNASAIRFPFEHAMASRLRRGTYTRLLWHCHL